MQYCQIYVFSEPLHLPLISSASSLHWLPVFSFKIILIKARSTYQTFFAFTLLLGSSGPLETIDWLEYHPPGQSLVVSTLSFTRLLLLSLIHI